MEQQFRERMRQIKKNRDAFLRDPDRGIILSAEAFMSIVNKYVKSQGKYSWCDNPSCAYMGVSDVDRYEEYYCPIEDFTEDEIRNIERLKPQLPK